MKNQESTERVQTKVMYFSLCLIQNYLLFECLFCTEKWLINQNFKISQDKRIPEPRPAL